MMRLLITRPEPDASAMATTLESAGHEVVIEPLLTVDYDHCDPIDLYGIDALIATSRNGLKALRASLAFSEARPLPVFAVGEATATLARNIGLKHVYSADGQATDLIPLITGTLTSGNEKILHLAGAELAVDIATPLSKAGFNVAQQVVYRAKAVNELSQTTLDLFPQGEIDGVILMSPRTAQAYVQLLQSHDAVDFARKSVHFCLSKLVSEKLEPLGSISNQIALKPNMKEMLALIAHSAQKIG